MKAHIGGNQVMGLERARISAAAGAAGADRDAAARVMR
jgi:hypothetical protein